MTSVAYNCDCVEGMKSLPAGCIDMTITSPPYDSIRDYKGFTFDYQKTLDELFRVTKDGGVCLEDIEGQVRTLQVIIYNRGRRRKDGEI